MRLVLKTSKVNLFFTSLLIKIIKEQTTQSNESFRIFAVQKNVLIIYSAKKHYANLIANLHREFNVFVSRYRWNSKRTKFKRKMLSVVSGLKQEYKKLPPLAANVWLFVYIIVANVSEFVYYLFLVKVHKRRTQRGD